ncbi:MAG: methionyl-tRNA formyltransferase, partial [Geminicoccaceae bacterium]
PRWRGAAPIQRALLAGDRETGISIFQMEPSLDTGPVLAMERLPITPETTAQDLHDALAAMGSRSLLLAIDSLASGRACPVPQPEQGVTYAHKIDKSEGRLEWSRPAALLERQLRALNPWPGCWTELHGERLLVLAGEVVSANGPPGEVLDQRLTVACGTAALRLTKVQRAGAKPLSAADFLRGVAVPVGTRLGPPCRVTS